MDNYFQNCPARMDDGRFLTDFRSSTVREQLFRDVNNFVDENKARTARIDHAEEMMDEEWDQLNREFMCDTRKFNYNTNPKTLTTTTLNNAKILAYNGMIPAPVPQKGCTFYRLTSTEATRKNAIQCKEIELVDHGYPQRSVYGINPAAHNLRVFKN